MKKSFGEFFRQLRKSNKMNLREFSREHGFDHGNISRLERGLLKPPQTQDSLEEYARALNLKPDTPEWEQFFVLAALETRRIPHDIAENPTLADKLPKVFSKIETRRRTPWTSATELERWADTLDARSSLPQLIRRLIHATIDSIDFMDFPAGEDVGRPGWDGMIRTEKGNAFVPYGQSCWEMGVDKDIKGKADDDFKKRSTNTEDFNQKETVFVFVTPRKWTRKNEWVNEKKKLGIWKDVRVYDSSNIEQWLEIAPVVDAWFSRPDGVTDIEVHWENLKLLTVPTLRPDIFLITREKNIEALKNWLVGSPSHMEFEASSPDELFDFVAAFIESLDENERNKVNAHKIVIVGAKEAWQTLISSEYPIVLIPRPSIEVEEELIAEARRRGHYMLLWNEITNDPKKRNNRLSRVYRFELEKTLESSGLKREEARRIARESGGSLTVLKRRIARLSSVKIPEWANPDAASELVPILLLGGWNESHEADRKIIEKLSGQPYDRVEEIVNRRQKGKDAPLMKALDNWRFVSRDDSWTLLAPYLTLTKLKQFEKIAVEVLGEENPEFELPPEERWRAAIYDKTPKYSHQLRKGIAETLALLGVIPPTHLLTDSPPPERRVESVIEKLLAKDARWQRWASLSDLLPILAEASPDAFLKSLDRDLKTSDPQVLKLFIAEGDPFFSSPPHVGLLWALEALAWNSSYLTSVSEMLAILAQATPNVRSGNNPMNSLQEIFLPWYPQTTASVDDRITVLKKITKKFSSVGWQLLLSLLPEYRGFTNLTHRPMWHNWSLNWSDRVPMKDYYQQVDACAEILLGIVETDIDKWLQLIEKFEHFPPSAQNRLLNSLRKFDLMKFDANAKQLIAETLREKVSKHRRFSDTNWALPARTVESVEEIQKRFESEDLLTKHKWLFEYYPHIPDQSPRDSLDKYEEAVFKSRTQALEEILTKEGLPRIIELAKDVDSPGDIGIVLAKSNMVQNDLDIIPQYLSSENTKIADFARGYVFGCLRRKNRDNWEWVERLPINQWTPEQAGKFLISLQRFDRKTWDIISELSPEVSDYYWSHVSEFCREAKKENVEYAVSKLIEHKRPNQAIDVINMALFKKCELDSSLIMETLAHLQQGISGHLGFEIQELFKKLQSDPDIDVQRLARLEWRYLNLLDGRDVFPKTLQNSLQTEPGFFAFILSKIYRSRNEQTDLGEPPTEEQSAIATNAYTLLYNWKTLPGTLDNNTINEHELVDWVKKAREICNETGHIEVCDVQIGELFAHAPEECDGSWPCIPVRNIIEEIASEELEEGFEIGIVNKRGTVWRSLIEGGEKERDLAKKYHDYAEICEIKWPRTAATLRAVAKSYEADAHREDERAKERL
ncbi:MAG: helix-turn-helix transcriptional regulator [Deltaproteobacteria bacterium]